ncbi:hypothetical protein LWI29_019382 [Acer saccharum]|uniref:RNase H type-1 domain-containing protein n=1 Tax=Acer saccharum TaxID=4024 RepID=A0AA39W358_ACESA|nr:hypothetical protein LWI29_019382 [Acer saccharum]
MATGGQRLVAIFEIINGYSPQVVEALAILRGIDFAIDTCLVPAAIESDELRVVNLSKACDPNANPASLNKSR